MRPAPRRSLSAAVVVMLAALAAGCKGDKKKHAGTAADPFVIGMSQCNLGEPWRAQMNADIAKAAADAGDVKVVFKDAQNDSLAQRAQVEELVAQGIDALIISPKEAAPLTQPVAEVYKRGIPVIVLDRAVQGDAFTMFIGADNKKIGARAGRFVAQTLGGKGKIVELKGLMTSTPGQDRHDGFREGLDVAKNPGLEIVFEADMKWLEGDARVEMESALARAPQIDLVYAHNDPGAHGAYLAAKAAGRAGIKFVGIDALPQEGVRYVKDGILDATFAYPTGGGEAIDAVRKLLRGEKPDGLSGQAGPQPHRKLTLGTRLYTRDNVDKGGEAVP